MQKEIMISPKNIQRILTHVGMLIGGMLVACFFTDRHMREALPILSSASSAIVDEFVPILAPIDELILNYVDGSWWATKQEFFNFFGSKQIFDHATKSVPLKAPIDTASFDVYTVILSRESRGVKPVMPTFVPPRAIQPAEDVASPEITCYLTVGFSKTSGLTQWWYIWLDK